MRHSRIAVVLAALVLLVSSGVTAQSAQLWSLQFSGLGSAPFGGAFANLTPGWGWEGQLRVSPGTWSFGFGAEQTFHGVNEFDSRRVSLLGAFFEPRVVIFVGSEVAAPYLAARVALTRFTVTDESNESTADGFTANGGGGLLVVLSDRVNLDLGVTVGYKQLGQGPGLLVSDNIVDWGSGANAIGRVGLAIGLGG